MIKSPVKGNKKMSENWEASLKCAASYYRCNKKLGEEDKRILSVVDHQPVCTDLKKLKKKDRITLKNRLRCSAGA